MASMPLPPGANDFISSAHLTARCQSGHFFLVPSNFGSAWRRPAAAMVSVDTVSLITCTIGSMAATNPATMLLVTVLVDTKVLAEEGMEDDAARPVVDGAALLLLAALIHVRMDGPDRGGGGCGIAGKGPGGAMSRRPLWCGCSGNMLPRWPLLLT